MEQYTYLALGDSYTIGEGVPLADSFPYQAVQLLRQQGLPVCAPEIIAVTGWTTDELAAAIAARKTLNSYSMVSLLIGVNNQYRGRSHENYTAEFEGLLQQAVQFAGGRSQRVFVLSIPDWTVTPFAAGSGREGETTQIDAFNAAKRKICGLYNAVYIDITASQREDGAREAYLASDRLHPSGKEYAKWAVNLAANAAAALKGNDEQF